MQSKSHSLSTSAFLQTMTDYPRDDPDTNNSLSFNDKTNQNKINPQRRKLPHYQEWKQVIRDIFFYVNLYFMVNSSIVCAYEHQLVHLYYKSFTQYKCSTLVYDSIVLKHPPPSPCIQLFYCSETPSPCIQLKVKSSYSYFFCLNSGLPHKWEKLEV